MKTALFYLPIFLLCSVLVRGQNADSLAVMREVDSLIRVSLQLSSIGKFEEAFQINDTATNLTEATFGKIAMNYARCIFYRGIVCENSGEYAQGARHYEESMHILQKALGKENPAYVITLLPWIHYASAGRYWSVRKESFYPEAQIILEKSIGKENPDYAQLLQCYGLFYQDRERYDRAEQLFLEAKNIRGKTLGKGNDQYAESLFSLGILYAIRRKETEAGQYFLEAREVWGKTHGKQSGNFMQATNHLAGCYIRTKRYEEAETILLETKKILAETNQKQHYSYQVCLSSLARIYNITQQYAEAEQCYLEIKDYYEAQGNMGIALSQIANIGYMYADIGKCDKAELNIERFYKTVKHDLIRSSHRLTSIDLSIKAENAYKGLIALARTHFNKSNACKVPGVRYDIALFFKGFMLESAFRIKKLALSDSASALKYQLFQECHTQLAKEYAKPASMRQGTEALELRAEVLEKELARSVSGFSDAIHIVSWKEVQDKLKPGEATLEFMHYQYRQDTIFYTAVLLSPNANAPLFIPLFEEKQLLPLLAQNRASQGAAPLYASRGAKPLAASQGGTAELFELLWSPLKRHLKGIKTVWYSPSGALHRVNFDAIPLPDRRTLSDKYRLARLGSTRSLVVPDKVTIGSNSAILFGGIQYELDTTTVLIDSTRLKQAETSGSSGLSFSYAGRGENWTYLPGTAKEVSDIDALFQKSDFSSRIYSKDAATEELFKSLGGPALGGSPRILHLATHGFFFPDPKSERERSERVSGESEPVFKISDHPMIRSGLILAGGNHAWATGKPIREGMEDGILTAYEISQMNLSNTELVVLSACETGLGDIQGNEGVYGLQRAFKIAGAKYLIMSLWQVPDQETSVFMTTFYRHWLEGKMTIPDAFRATQREMRERFGDPYRWAGFVLVE